MITLGHYDAIRQAIEIIVPYPTESQNYRDYPVKVDTYSYEDVDEISMHLDMPDGTHWSIRCEVPKTKQTEQEEQDGNT